MSKHIFILALLSIVLCSTRCSSQLMKITNHVNPASTSLDQPEHDQLELVFLFHRHGERTPYCVYPKDPFAKNLTEQPPGIGQMLKSGKQRLYNLGRYLSRRYFPSKQNQKPGPGQFLHEKSTRKVYARSSASERCLQSVSLLLAGMYPPETDVDQWNDGLGKLWQPIPIQTSPFEHDTFLNPGYECPAAQMELDRIYQSDKAKQLEKENGHLLDMVANYTGFNREQMSLVYAGMVYDILLSEHNAGYPPPEWLTEEIRSGLKYINDQVFYFNSTTRKTQRFRAGSILNEICNRMEEHFQKRDNPNRRHVFIYSTHDEWLAILLSALKVYNNIPPSFGSTVILEVYQKHQNGQTEQAYIKGFYLNQTETEKTFELTFPDCPEPCTIQKFKKSVEDLIAKDYILQRECLLDIRRFE